MRRRNAWEKSSKFIVSLICMIFMFQTVSFGAAIPTNEELLKQIQDLKKIIISQNERISDLEKKVAGQEISITAHSQIIETGELADLSRHMEHQLERLKNIGGIQIGAGMTLIGQGTPNANNGDATDGENSRFDGSWSADIEIAKEFEYYGSTSLTTGGMAFLHMESGQGDTVESELSLFSNVNRDAGDSAASVDITEAWYEQYLFDEQLTVTAGRIDATGYIDTNAYANDECTQFLGHIFRNSAVIDWPDDNSFGGRINLAPAILPFTSMDLICMEEDGDWENLFDNPFIGTQFNIMPAKIFGYDEEMWGGNYRVYFWYNGAPHAKVKNTDDIERGNIGWGLSCDQMITDIFGIFGRFGWADPEKNDLGYDWSAGAQIIGRYWDRENDVAAVAVGQAIPGDDYRDINEYDNAETHLEVYYAVKVTDHLTLTPDMQVIWEPNGGGTSFGKDPDTIFVYGIRGQVDF